MLASAVSLMCGARRGGVAGHGGRGAAEFAQKSLHRAIAERLRSALPAKAVADAMGELEVKFRAVAQSSRDPSGACALAALVIGRRVYIGNVGDCRAALVCFAGALGVRVRSLTTDHKPSDLAERARVKAAGGTVRRKTMTKVRPGPGIRSLPSLYCWVCLAHSAWCVGTARGGEHGAELVAVRWCYGGRGGPTAGVPRRPGSGSIHR